jgi:hypothetical protein
MSGVDLINNIEFWVFGSSVKISYNCSRKDKCSGECKKVSGMRQIVQN